MDKGSENLYRVSTASDTFEHFDSDVDRLLDDIEPEYEGFVRMLNALDKSLRWIVWLQHYAFFIAGCLLLFGLAKGIFLPFAIAFGGIGVALRRHARNVQRVEHLRRLSSIADVLEDHELYWQICGVIASVIVVFLSFLVFLGFLRLFV